MLPFCIPRCALEYVDVVALVNALGTKQASLVAAKPPTKLRLKAIYQLFVSELCGLPRSS